MTVLVHFMMNVEYLLILYYKVCMKINAPKNSTF